MNEESRKTDVIGHKEYICGFGAAFINICVTFPINKIMFRQMVHGVTVTRAVTELRKEGLMYLYRGLMPPLMQKTATVSIMFGSYKEYHCSIKENFPEIRPMTALTISAILAGMTEALLTPFERVQVLLQDKRFHNEFNNTIHTFKELRKYGLTEYYRGLTPILIRNALSNVMFFSLREQVKNSFPKADKLWTNSLEDFFTGAVTGAIISTVFYPVNVIKTKMQCEVGTQFMSMRTAAKYVYQERNRSIRKIFYGVHINYTRALISWGIINTSYELLLKLFQHESKL
ncbi:solute carrier family 25 member 51-like protein [Leptotrombidium deliense]|uniref:Solute carrier family 25 member 51-like protein n=1 Tax=Leptotrombidium deliense TaxID=299467 RepID=A0A443SVY7_9ACAR|nr:solute carrier family 25 member 51-like protein [Leptotrombidium deliense]